MPTLRRTLATLCDGPVAAFFLPVLLALPFVTKPLHIDGPGYVWIAQHMVTQGIHFLDFECNWGAVERPVHELVHNGPLFPLLLAPVGWLFQWREVFLNLLQGGIAGVAGLGIYRLSQQFTRQALLATVLAVVTPAFVMASTLIMTDLLLLACYLWAMVFWLNGLERRSPGWMGLSSLCMSGAVLTKYFGFSVLLLLAAYTLMQPRRCWKQLGWLLVPFAVFVAYEVFIGLVYGQTMLHSAIVYAGGIHEMLPVEPLNKPLTALVFVGGCLAPVCIAAFLGGSWRWWGANAVLLGAALVFASAHMPETAITAEEPRPWWVWSQWAVWLVLGANMLAVAVAALARERDAKAWLLFLWVAGTLVFITQFNHLINGRVAIPAVIPLAIVAAQRLEAMGGRARRRWRALAAIGVGLVLSLSLAYADYRQARVQKRAAWDIVQAAGDAPVWFFGHFGFQHYMQQFGARIIDERAYVPRPGDVVAVPLSCLRGPSFRPVYEGLAEVRLPAEVPPIVSQAAYPPAFLTYAGCRGLTPFRTRVHAGFHADIFGTLPFTFGPIPALPYAVLMVGDPDNPPAEPLSFAQHGAPQTAFQYAGP